ncbi:uncharacterized protein LOC124450585 [Xenia sp. Carnegie-2017]|uniref:uncharacterized protein LOC124450585 n=1 Tax=Xenia sp. Carnegie-2017 TaxID=2897299 RepID=UPI001F03A857|nr:uncharacterized protein LOC124450585 [Xenia sp. Carnegie-2017]
MLEEIIGFALSVCSLFAADTPRVSSNTETLPENTNVEFREIENDAQKTFINKEYDENNYARSSEDFVHGRSNLIERNYENCQNSRKVWRTFWKCLWINLNIIVASIISIAFCTTLVYVAMNTAYSCLDWQSHNNNKTLPLSIKRAHIFGRCVESLTVYLWFPFTMMILFGWKEFKAMFLSTIYIAVIFSELNVIYKLISFQFNVYDTYSYYVYPPSVLFWVSIVLSTFVVLYNIRAFKPFIPYSNFHITVLIIMQFVFCTLISYFYKFIIIPEFNNVRVNLFKFLIATSSPLLAIIPTVLCGHLASRKSSKVVHPGRSFIMVYMIRGGVIFLYRTMQTNFKSIWLFLGLSLFSAVLNFSKKATQELRFKLWKRMISALNKLRCFKRLQVLPWNTARARRLKADLEIQDILFEYNTLVLSQAYFISYQLQSFNIATEPLLYEFLKRIVIGVLIDFIFNCLSNYVQMYYYNIPIGRVWKKYWKRHLFANVVVVLVIISYFSRDLESVFQSHFQKSGASSTKHSIRNCSLL